MIRAPREGARRWFAPLLGVLLVGALLAAAPAPTLGAKAAEAKRRPVAVSLSRADAAFLDTLERRTFEFFRDHTDPRTGLSPDRWPTPSFASSAAGGFALTAWPIGAERRWMTREEARTRARNTLEFLWRAPQGDAVRGMTGHRGFFYHFLDPVTGARFENVELSTVDTALLLGGALFCQSYFDREHPDEARIRALTDSLVARVDWRWASVRPPTIVLGWDPERGPQPYDWRGYNEALLMHVLALGSPTHALGPETWKEWESGYRWGTFHGQSHLGFGPMFGHHFSHVWIDFRGIRDPWMREHGIDYFENTRRATLAQRAYAIANPRGYRGYGADAWGLSACDGPLDRTLRLDGRDREFFTYRARGASFTEVVDDGTLTPSAVGGSVPFAPEVCVPTLRRMRETYGDALFGRYGFVDAFNPTLNVETDTHHGRVTPGVGWFDTDYIGIDQGAMLAMIENHRSGLVWRTMRRNAHLVRGLKAAGFTGGWLDAAGGTR